MNRRAFMKRTAGSIAALVAAGAMPGFAAARTGADEIAKLGSALTPVGALKEGNADGLIAPWSGKWNGVPPGLDFAGTGNAHPDPYAAEKPLFTITAQNYRQYAERLSEGQKAMFEKYPNTFRMPVYPCHRDFRFSDWTHEQIRKNAGLTELTADGEGVTNVLGGVAFPFPKNGLEAIWNVITAPKVFSELGPYDEAVVYPNGTIAWGGQDWDIYCPPYDPATQREGFGLESALVFRETTKPERERGAIALVREYWNFSEKPTQTWQYIPGTRRVKQVPEIAGDYPLGPGGFHTVDDTRLWTQSPKRYDWELVGRKEIFVPYNNYRLNGDGVKYRELLLASHLNPDYMRWELHRVWVLKARLKPGVRHIYSARTIYVDEDSWQPLLADIYDARGQLYRQEMNAVLYAYEAQVFLTTVVCYHDLVSGAYMADRLVNELPSRPRYNAGGRKISDYSAEALKRRGN